MQGVRIALDAFGGDNAPEVNIDGAFLALEEFHDLEIVLVGKEESLKPLLKETPESSRIRIVDAGEVFPMSEKPSLLLRKKETSLYKAAQQVKDGKGDALVSAGNTGGVLAAALFIVGRIKGVDRGAIAVYLPPRMDSPYWSMPEQTPKSGLSTCATSAEWAMNTRSFSEEPTRRLGCLMLVRSKRKVLNSLSRHSTI
jgi:fatty acid/phospholipid biosynthesis enzyme